MSTRYAPLLLAVAGPLLLGAAPAHAQEDSLASRAALLAQVGGADGCQQLDSVKTLNTTFFLGIRMQLGFCIRPDGRPATGVIALDSVGTIFPLNSHDGYRDFIRAHPPNAFAPDWLVSFVFMALAFRGDVPATSSLVMGRSSIAEEFCNEVGVNCMALVPRMEQGGRVVYLATHDRCVIYMAGPITVNQRTGEVSGPVRKSRPRRCCEGVRP